MKTQNRTLVLIVSFLLLAALACSLTGTQQPQPPTPVAITVPVNTEVPSPTQAPTEAPTSTPSLVPTTAGRMVTFQNILFVVPNGLSQSETGQIMPAVMDGAGFDIPVEYIKFSFTGYPLSGTSNEPVIEVFPTDGYTIAKDIISNLKDLLSLRPAEANQIPYLPITNSAQVFHAKVKYMDFGSGSGVRYLTQMGQGIWPINSKDMFYTYQGLTSDGKYYISVLMPVSSSVVPATGEGADLNQLGNDYLAYVNGVRTQLEAQPDDSYTPSLAALDALVQSIKVR